MNSERWPGSATLEPDPLVTHLSAPLSDSNPFPSQPLTNDKLRSHTLFVFGTASNLSQPVVPLPVVSYHFLPHSTAPKPRNSTSCHIKYSGRCEEPGQYSQKKLSDPPLRSFADPRRSGQLLDLGFLLLYGLRMRRRIVRLAFC